MISDNAEDWADYVNEIKASTLSNAEQETIRELQLHLKRLLKSDNQKTRKQAEILKAYCDGKNRLEISKETGINYKIIHESIEEIKNRIKFDMTGIKVVTKNDITIKLRAEGSKPAYSGKNKTFYVVKLPGGAVCEDIKKAGFNVCKK
jgi:hypothetical protein